MSVAVCRVPAAFQAPAWLRPAELYKPEVVVADDRPAQVDIWNAIQAAGVDDKVAAAKKVVSKPYVSPRVRRSMSQKSLEICTESLGCETGSGDFTASLDAVDMLSFFGSPLPAAPVEAEESFWQHSAAYPDEQPEAKDDLVAVNYHRSGVRRSPPRSFPPPLPSMSSRDGTCLKMCSSRQDGRLVVEAVVVRPRGYLQANRQDGRLCLSFIECSARGQGAASNGSNGATEASSYFPIVEDKCEQEQQVAMEMDEEDEEEVEVVDRGTVVEVKVSSQPQAPAAAKVHRSTLVINKFVGSTPFTFDQPRGQHADAPLPEPSSRDEAAPKQTLRRVPSSTTTLAAAVAVASTETGAPPTPCDDDEDDDEGCGGQHPSALATADNKQQHLLLFTSRRGDKHDLLQSVRRCRQLRQNPLFILEPYCIAT